MSLRDLIRGKRAERFATAIVATPATEPYTLPETCRINSNGSKSSSSKPLDRPRPTDTTVATVATIAVATDDSRTGRLTQAGERCADVLDRLDNAGCLLWIGYDGALRWPANTHPGLTRLIIDYRQDLSIEVSARGIYADEREAFEERAAVIAQDGEVTREDAERQALASLRAAQRSKLPAHVELDLMRLLDAWNVRQADREAYRVDLTEHARRETWSAAHAWLREALNDATSGQRMPGITLPSEGGVKSPSQSCL